MQVFIPFLSPDEYGDTVNIVEFDAKVINKSREANISSEVNEFVINKYNSVIQSDKDFTLNLGMITKGIKAVKIAELHLTQNINTVDLISFIKEKNLSAEIESMINSKTFYLENTSKEYHPQATFNYEVYQTEIENKQYTCSNVVNSNIEGTVEQKDINNTFFADVKEMTNYLTGSIANKIAALIDSNHKQLIYISKGLNYLSIPFFLKDNKIAKVEDFVTWVANETNQKPTDVFSFVACIDNGNKIEYIPNVDYGTDSDSNFPLIKANGENLMPVGLEVYSNANIILEVPGVVNV